MANKKGIELSINFVVIMILSIIMLGLGVMMVTKFMNAASPIEQCPKSELDRLLARDRVVACPSSGELYPGKEGTFTVGIKNTEDPRNFRVNVQAVAGVDRQGSSISHDNFEFTYETEFVLNKNADPKLFGLIIKVPPTASKGAEYAINVRVCSATITPPPQLCDGISNPPSNPEIDHYGLQKIYITIPS